MASPETTDETRVDEGYSVTVPSDVREKLDIEPGDTLRWVLADDGSLQVEVVKRRYGAFDDLDPVDAGEATDAVEETEERAYGSE